MNNNLLFKILFITLLLTFKATAVEKIVFIDLQFILSNSSAGKALSSQIKKIEKQKIPKIEKTQTELRNEEKKLISQKNILEVNEYKKKVNLLRKKIILHNKEKKFLLDSLKNKQFNGRNEIIKAMTPILKDYASKNSISLILQKNKILLGDTKIDITNEILELLNKKIKKIDLN